MKKYFFPCLALSLFLSVSLLSLKAQTPASQFRAAWFSTVANIDWPSKAAIGHTELQKQEMVDLLNQMQALNLNTVIFQIRPTADALYPSELEPWSNWLTGKQGQNNDIPYDPLAFMVEQAHQRHMDVHIWINPYRVTLPSQKREDLAPNHLINRHPEMFWEYAGQWYFEPGLDETRQWLCNVVADIVTRYDIQGVHLDDYFYPYPKKGIEIPDAACFRAHPRGFTNIEDWRRNNVNLAIKEMHETIHAIKPEVQLGISPFGIWRNIQSDPRGSKTNGLQNYDDLYADILLWMQEGWIDYVVPQLYWEIGKKVADHEILAYWWANQINSPEVKAHGCKLYIGMSVGRLQDPKLAPKNHPVTPDPTNPWQNGNEICRQMDLHKDIPGIDGEVFFSLRALLRNPLGVCDSLKNKYFRKYVSAPKPVAPEKKEMIDLKPLHAGDTIMLITPSSLPFPKQVSDCVKGLQAWGYHVIKSDKILKSPRTVQDRYDDLMQGLRNPHVKALFCVRGGYASADVMDILPLDTLRKYPKWIIGYSDITACHAAWHAAGIPSIHSSMAAVWDDLAQPCVEATKEILAGKLPDYHFQTHPQNICGKVEGTLIGGNMCVMTGTFISHFDPTSYDPNERFILLIEDVQATSTDLHRFLTLADHTGLLKRTDGIIMGELTGFIMKPGDMSGTSHGGAFRDGYDIVARLLLQKGYNIPIALRCPIGHGKENYPLLMGQKVHLDITPNDVHIYY